ncbi:hypothetical protein M8J77_019764 [Diaphorina citri]|nr:hypothetical protein M8J77_019764 [Diaphorina citri]
MSCEHIRTQIGHKACYGNWYNLKRWGYVDDDLCDCGAAQTNGQLLTCGQLQQTCTQNDLLAANDRALYVADYWKFNA